MPPVTGRRLPLSLPRRWVADLMHVSRGFPIVTVERRMDLSPLMTARAGVADPPSWAAVFLKAYAVVAAGRPDLRRAYVRFPWPHLYEADHSLASVAVARDYRGDPAVFFGLVHAPDRQSLAQLTARMREFRTKPVEAVRPFARLIRYARYPLPVRRVVWWLGVNLSGRHRAKTFGTFGLTAIGGTGAALVNVISPLTTALTYGPVGADGSAVVRLSFDHRVLDGVPAAAALAELEAVLNGAMVRELA